MNITMEDLLALGWRPSPAIGQAMKLWNLVERRGSMTREEFLAALRPPGPVTLPAFSAQEARLIDAITQALARFAHEAHGESNALRIRDEPVPCPVWGREEIEPGALAQMDAICRVEPAVRGALMPDAHHGYSMPIGGVLATENAVIPPAVGVDIACRMRMSVLAVPFARFEELHAACRNALVRETSFGMNASFKGTQKRQHDVMDDPRWGEVIPALARLRDKAWTQLGSSGGGNHFVEWGELRLAAPAEVERSLGVAIPPAPEGTRWLALLSHSGSRGFGAAVAEHYTRLAADRSGLEKPWCHLAWLSLDDEPGHEYWTAMELAGAYASANHRLIHDHVLRASGLSGDLLFAVENHHNFAWKEVHDGRELVVHRKGATPAGAGVLGLIPGSMADPGYLVRGRGNAAALDSASHGAGRRMSRTAAKNSVTRAMMREVLAQRGVELLGGDVDESPQAYKDIGRVLALQHDLVDILAEFRPKLVRMA